MSQKIPYRQANSPAGAGPGGIFWLARRSAALLVCAVLALGLFCVYAGPSLLLAVYRLVVDGGLAVAWAASAAGAGWGLWRAVERWNGIRRSANPLPNPPPEYMGRGKKEPPPEYMGREQLEFMGREKAAPALIFVSCLAFGLGMMSLAILGLGLMGRLNRGSAIGLLVPGWACDVLFLTIHRKRWETGTWLAQRATWEWLWAILMPLLAIVLIGAMFPPGVLWGQAEPNGYDVTEYHLQVPREWYEAGRIVPLHHNVFSYFPFNVEMHYLLAMEVRGGPWAGMYLAQLMHMIFCLAVVSAVFGIAGGGKRGIVAAALAAAPAWLTLLAPIAYDEGGMLLFAALAIGWAMRGENWRHFALAGAMAGFAAGAKLTAAAMVIAAVPPAMLLAGIIHGYRNRKPIAPVFFGAAVFILAATITFSPWPARNLVWTGNPVFPEAMGIFGKAHFSQVQEQRWQRAYEPDAKYRALGGHLTAVYQQIIRDPGYGYLLLPLGVVSIFLAWRKRQTIFLAMMLLIVAVIWLFFTHLQSRFFVLAIPIAALLAVQIDWPGWLEICAAVAVVMAMFSINSLNTRIDPYLDFEMIGKENLLPMELAQGFNPADLKPDTTLVLVGDAKAFWYQIPMSRLFYKTVFDVDTSDANRTVKEDWVAGLKATKSKQIVDESELARFHLTYGTPDLPPDWRAGG